MRALRAASLSVCVLVLAACSSIHPGAAVVLDGEDISMDTLDDTARVYCLVTSRSAQSQGVAAIDNAQVRRQAANDLVMQRIAADLVRERDLQVDSSLGTLTGAQVSDIRAAFGDDAEAVTEAIRRSQQLYAQLVAIGADTTGRTPNADILDPLADAGQQEVSAAYASRGVKFAPRLGLDDDGQPDGGVGSLSVGLPAAADAATEAPTGPVGCSA